MMRAVNGWAIQTETLPVVGVVGGQLIERSPSYPLANRGCDGRRDGAVRGQQVVLVGHRVRFDWRWTSGRTGSLHRRPGLARRRPGAGGRCWFGVRITLGHGLEQQDGTRYRGIE